MLVALGEDGVKSVEDFAGCAADDLVGWTERKTGKDGETVRHKGILEGFDLSRKEAEDMIMAARVILGWIPPEDLGPEEELEAEEADEAAAGEAGQSA